MHLGKCVLESLGYWGVLCHRVIDMERLVLA